MKKNSQNTKTDCSVVAIKNPIAQMIEDKKKMIKAINNGENISSVKGVKFVSPL